MNVPKWDRDEGDFYEPTCGPINQSGYYTKIGNMLYDYGNSVWLASMGTIGKTVLGIYQISELVTGILVNPFEERISDRFLVARF